MCQGEREMAGDNKLLGQFTLVGIRNLNFMLMIILFMIKLHYFCVVFK